MGEPEANARWRPGAGPATPTIDDDEVVIDYGRAAMSSGSTFDLTGSAAAQRVSDWVERMRAKRQRDQAHILGTDPERADRLGGPTHWASHTVSGRDTTFDTGPASLVPGASDPMRCLGVLGLDSGATSDELAAAYRSLAKVHHPDRWAEADPEVQREHSEQMLRVNAAYETLRSHLPA